MKKQLSLLTASLAFASTALTAQTMINVDLGAGTSVGTGTAGAVASDGWQQKIGYPNFTNLTLTFDDASAAATTISGTGAGNLSSIGAATTDGDYSMFNRGLSIQGSGSFSTITLNNLASDFTSNYDIYVYFSAGADASGTDVVSTFSITDGTSTYFYKSDETQASYQGSYIQATATDAGSSSIANFVKFSNLSADTITISAQNSGNLTAGASMFTGMQIVAVPEVSSYSLLAGFCSLAWIMVRRRRN